MRISDWRSDVCSSDLTEQVAGLVEHRVRVGADPHHEVRGRHLHLRGQRPHVQVVHVDHTGEATEIGFDVVEVDSRGSVLDPDAPRLAAEPHPSGPDPGAYGPPEVGVDPAPAVEVDEHAAGCPPTSHARLVWKELVILCIYLCGPLS